MCDGELGDRAIESSGRALQRVAEVVVCRRGVSVQHDRRCASRRPPLGSLFGLVP